MPCAHRPAPRLRGSASIYGTSARSTRKPEVHHIATIENEKSTSRGGPWTKAFKPIFDKAGMSMKDPANTVSLLGHRGPHPEEYHQAVFRHLKTATENCSNQQACAVALRKALRELAAEISDTGSLLHKLLTRGASP